jgi:MYXO-CTERM domain-containing protein
MTGSVIVSAVAPAPSNPPVVGLARGGGGPQLPIGAALLLLGLGLLAARCVRRDRPHGAGEGIDKLPHQ